MFTASLANDIQLKQELISSPHEMTLNLMSFFFVLIYF